MPQTPAFVGSVQLNVRHWLTATVLMESTRFQLDHTPAFSGRQPEKVSVQQPDSDTTWYAGLRLGSVPGLVADGLAAVTSLVFLGIFLFDGGD